MTQEEGGPTVYKVKVSGELVTQALLQGETFRAATVIRGLPKGTAFVWAKAADALNETTDLELYFSTEEDRAQFSPPFLIGRAYADIGVVELQPLFEALPQPPEPDER